MRRSALTSATALFVSAALPATATALVGPDAGMRPVAAVAAAAHVRLVQLLEAGDLGLASISGLAYGDSLLLVSGATSGASAVLASVSPLGLVDSTRPLPPGLGGTSGLAYDEDSSELVAERGQRLVRVGARPGQPSGTRDAGSAPHAAGIGVSADGSILALEAATPTVVDLDDGTATALEGVDEPLAGLASAPDGHLFTISAAGSTIYEFAPDGRLVATRDISDAGLIGPVDVELAPSADPTDDAGKLNLYVADGATGIAEFELQATPLAASALAATTETATLVNTIEGATLTPDSPDPSGISYSAGIDRLVMVDGEIEESDKNSYPYPGTNGWVFPRSGSPTSQTFDTTNDTCSVDGSTVRNREPVGVAHDPDRNVYYVTQDGKNVLYVLSSTFAPVGCIGLAQFGVADAEGIGYGAGDIFLADGTGGEIWRIDPGSNGVFGTATGAGPHDEVVVNHFDTSSLGQPDPEGVEYDASTGNLYLVSNKDGSPILEVTTTGSPVRTITPSGVVLGSARGLTLAPGTNEAAQHIFVADARADNNENQGAIDGRIYELAVGASAPSEPDTTITSGPSGTVASRDASFSFTGTGNVTSFECRLDTAAFAACTSPQAYTALADGQHTFEVRALDGSTPDPTPATRTWTVDLSAPPPTDNLLSNPSFELDANGNSIPDDWGSNAKFTRSSAIAAHEGAFVGRHFDNNAKVWQQVAVTPGTTYDFSGWVNLPATSDPFSFQLNVQWRAGGSNLGVPVVIHNFTDDTAGAWEVATAALTAPEGATAARVQMDGNSMNATGTAYVDAFFFGAGTPPPEPLDTSITSGPSGTVASRDASFSFTGTGNVTSFECRLDTAAFAACTSPQAYTALADGQHTFEVRALDGSTPDPTPATRTWTVDLSAPPPTDNLLSNPSFELDANGNSIPDDWGSNAKFTRSSAIAAHEGAFVGRHFATNDSGYTVFQQVAATPGTTYDFSGWVNVPATADSFTMNIRLRWMNGGSTISTTTIHSVTAATGGWSELISSRTAPAGTTAVRVMMAIRSLNATVYVDDFSLVAGP